MLGFGECVGKYGAGHRSPRAGQGVGNPSSAPAEAVLSPATLPGVIGRLGRGIIAVVSLALLLLPAGVAGAHGSGQSGAQASVINGTLAASGTFPFMAAVESTEGLCSGTVVSSNVILTAGHCVLTEENELMSPASFHVITGNVNRVSPSRTISTVSRVAINPNYTYLEGSGTPIRADVAVLGLSQPIPAATIPFATQKQFLAGTPVVMAGWGRTTPAGSAPLFLHYGSSVVQSSTFCASEEPLFLSAWNLCALDYPDEEISTCNGDSGGPLLMEAPGTSNQPLQIGITSYGFEGCSTTRPAYFARTDATATWLQGKIKEYAPPPAPAPPTSQATQPSPTLPRLTNRAAEKYTYRALQEGLGGRFRGHRAYRISCRSLSKTMRKCGVSFYVGDRDYWGNVTIYYLIYNGEVMWNDRYVIKSVSNHCLLVYQARYCPTKTYRR